MKLINNIINTGVTEGLPLETVKRIKVLNSIALFSTVMVVLTFLTISIFNILPEIKWLILIIGVNLAIPLVLNGFHKNISSRIYFVLISYAILIAMPLYLGFDLNYQFFILSGVGTPLMLFKDEIGWKKWILVGLALPVWLFIEWYGMNYPSLFQVPAEIAGTISLTNGAMVFLSVIFIFYTFIKQSDEQIAIIKKQKEDLVQLNDELEQFSYIVSHDLKAPLGGISTLIYFINEDYPDIDPALKSMHELMQERTSKMDELIQGVLNYTLAVGNTSNNCTFNTKELLTDIFESLVIPANIACLLDDDLPNIFGDKIQFQQIVTNIISNSVKYHHPTGGKVEVNYTADNKFHYFAISDNGPGIPEKYQKSIFNLFQKAHTTDRQDSTGIGLTIVHKLVKRNGGTILLDSKENIGTTFTFSWPK